MAEQSDAVGDFRQSPDTENFRKTQIRPLQEADIPAVIKMLSKNGRNTDIADHNLRGVLSRQSSGAEVYLLASQDAKIVGKAEINFSYKYAPYLEGLLVDKDFQKRGIGKEILEECERISGLRGCKEMFLAVDKFNAQTREYYERFGFAVTGESRQGPRQLYLMKKEIVKDFSQALTGDPEAPTG